MFIFCQLYYDAAYIDSLGEWIIYLFLVFPGLLRSESCQTQLLNALNDRRVVVIARDQLLDVMTEYSNLYNNSTPESLLLGGTGKSPKLQKKHINSVLKSKNIKKSDEIAKRHSRMRTLLRYEIRSLIDLTDTFPGVVPVKLPVLFACLALARYEILWLFTHMTCEFSSKSYRFGKDSLDAPFLPDLMYHTFKLATLILDSKNCM